MSKTDSFVVSEQDQSRKTRSYVVQWQHLAAAGTVAWHDQLQVAGSVAVALAGPTYVLSFEARHRMHSEEFVGPQEKKHPKHSSYTFVLNSRSHRHTYISHSCTQA